MLGINFNCSLVYNDAAHTWSQWDDPWFITSANPDVNWAEWVRASPDRTMILSVPLFPSNLDSTDWLNSGAAGDFDQYDVTLAKNPIAAGLGSSVIRLAWEANGTWYTDRVGNSPAQDAQWVQFWRNTALAMMSVPGAHFSFDWCVNANYRNIPLSFYYPGDDVVDEIGIDFYDAELPSSVSDRWDTLYNESNGLKATIDFANAHDKPISIPEWGVGPPSVKQGGGDDPSFVYGIANVVRDQNVAYQSYFFTNSWVQGLASYPNSLNAYRASFGNSATVTMTPASALASLPTPLPTL